MKRIFRENGLSIAMFALFFVFLIGMCITGYLQYNEDQREHHQPTETLIGYLGEGHFVEAVFENWESEFLQMGMYVFLTVFLYQKGSSESKQPGTIEAVDVVPAKSSLGKDAPALERHGGWAQTLYENSLGLAFFLLFLVSFFLHAAGGVKVYNQEQAAHGIQEQLSIWGYMASSRFWFESFQNWQSEFLAVFAIIVLSIFLRQKGSPESKPVFSSNSDTGSS